MGLSHDALVVAFGVDRSTVTRAIGQVRPLLAGRGFATSTGVRLRTLADVFASGQSCPQRKRGTRRSRPLRRWSEQAAYRISRGR